jgi:hypothetical protein
VCRRLVVKHELLPTTPPTAIIGSR